MARDYATARPHRLDFTDVYGFAGGQALGAAQAGMALRSKIEEPAAFGADACLDPANAPQLGLGSGWEMTAADPADWPPCETPVALSNPPCSGFSTAALSRRARENTGPASTFNECMWRFWHWVAESRTATGYPRVAAMESVTGANVRGDELMDQLAAVGGMEHQYRVVQNVAGLGGPQLRRRFWLVCSDEPLLWPADLLAYTGTSAVPTIAEALSGLPGHSAPGAWALPRWAPAADGHVEWPATVTRRQAVLELVRVAGSRWPDGASAKDLVPELGRPAWERADERLPGSLAKLERLADRIEANCVFKETAPMLLDRGGVCRTIVKSWPEAAIVRTLDGHVRFVTPREVLRLTGMPDDWSAAAHIARRQNASYYPAKGVVADAGRFLAAVIGDNLCGEATGRGWWPGDELPSGIDGQSKFLVDGRMDHKAVVDERTGERRDSRSDAWAADMLRRKELGGAPALL